MTFRFVVKENHMKTNKIVLIVVVALLYGYTNCRSQTSGFSLLNSDDKRSKALVKHLALPMTLCLSGVILNSGDSKNKFQSNVRSVFKGFRTHADDYLQYAPIIGVYTGELLGYKAQNNYWDRTKYLAMSEISMGIVVNVLKYTTKQLRPDNSSYNSFPSGHTAQAFTCATAMFMEYKDSNLWYASSGFLFAAATGALRMVNNRHWLPDVLLGAGVGTLSTSLIYYFKPFREWNPFEKTPIKSVSINPGINNNVQFGISIKLN